MADFRAIQEGLSRGYQMGRSTGGRLGGLGAAISKVANALKEQRVSQQELAQKRNLLGQAALFEGKIEPAEANDEEAFDVLGMGKVKSTLDKDKIENKIKLKIYKGEELTNSEKDYYNKIMLSTYSRTPFQIDNGQPVELESDNSPAPTGAFNPLRVLPGYAYYGNDKEGAYKSLKSKGISEKESVRRSGYKSIKSDGLESKAIAELKKAGYPVTPGNIKAVMEQLK